MKRNIIQNTFRIVPLVLAILFFPMACTDDEESVRTVVPEQPETLNELFAQYNRNIAAHQALLNGSASVVDCTTDGDDGFQLLLSNGKVADVYVQTAEENDIPLFGIDEDGYWCYRLGGREYALDDLHGNLAPALTRTHKGTFTPQLSLDKTGCWQVSYNGVQWFRLSDTPAPSLGDKTKRDFSLFHSVRHDEVTRTLVLSPRVGDAVLIADIRNNGTAQAWKRFVMNSADNVLLDYSYAGYDHGETAPKDGFAWGYKVYNVKEYMLEHNRKPIEAFIDILDKNKLIRKTNSKAANANARIVIYFPEGEYVLHEGEPGENSSSRRVFPYDIIGGNFVIKGDGPDKTRLVMKGSNGGKLAESDGYDVIPLLTIKNYSGSSSPVEVAANARKGEKTITLLNADNFKSGDWVELRLRSNDPELRASELGSIKAENSWAIAQRPDAGGAYNGVYIREYHQVKAVSGNRVTFYEPMMHDVDVKYKDYDGGWKLYKYNCYENVGIEDLTLEGNSVTPYYHHGDGASASEAWKHDSEYKMVLMMKLVNSWVRNVHFVSASDPLTFSESANCSAYDIEISGHRGHGAVRAAGSTRIFMGNVRDVSRDGVSRPNGVYGEGQWHGCGVSKPSMGTVVWRSNWGVNACFESHASQPRATLFDCCSGGLMYYHEGGTDTEAPNHLSDLTLWNLNVTGTIDENSRDYSQNFKWWDNSDRWWKIYPPIVVGIHGKGVTFSKEEYQLTYEESTGVKVTPESLYEAQLEKRLGRVPAWLHALK